MQPMLRVPVPSTLTTAGWRVYGLEAWISSSRTDIGAALGGHLDALGWIADRLLLTAPDEEAAPAVQRTPIDDARDAFRSTQLTASMHLHSPSRPWRI